MKQRRRIRKKKVHSNYMKFNFLTEQKIWAENPENKSAPNEITAAAVASMDYRSYRLKRDQGWRVPTDDLNGCFKVFPLRC